MAACSIGLVLRRLRRPVRRRGGACSARAPRAGRRPLSGGSPRAQAPLVTLLLAGPVANLLVGFWRWSASCTGCGKPLADSLVAAQGEFYGNFVDFAWLGRAPQLRALSRATGVLLFALLQVLVGVVSLLPLPPLEGGRLLFLFTPKTAGLAEGGVPAGRAQHRPGASCWSAHPTPAAARAPFAYLGDVIAHGAGPARHEVDRARPANVVGCPPRARLRRDAGAGPASGEDAHPGGRSRRVTTGVPGPPRRLRGAVRPAADADQQAPAGRHRGRAAARSPTSSSRSSGRAAPTWELGTATEFLLVAATLLDLKAARLLPSGEVEDEEDLALLEARDLLFARLLQYRAYKEVAALFAGPVRRAGPPATPVRCRSSRSSRQRCPRCCWASVPRSSPGWPQRRSSRARCRLWRSTTSTRPW